MIRIIPIALALTLGTAQAAELPVKITVDAATVESVAALDEKLEGLTATVEAMGDVRGDLATLKDELTALSNEVSALQDSVTALTDTVGGHTGSMEDNAAAIADLETKLSDIENRVIDLEARLTTSANEQAVLAFVEPYLKHGEPGPDVVSCGITWACTADLKSNPQYAGQPFVYPSIKKADEACRNPACEGIAILPGLHKIAEITRGQNSKGNTVYWRFTRNKDRIRAQDKTVPTAFDCRGSWGTSGDFCFFNQSDFVLTIEGVDCIADTQSQNSACYGATSQADSRLVLMDLAVSGIDNCVRTTGRWVALFRVMLVNCARTGEAHGIYASGDWKRGRFCPMLIMVDVHSTGNELAHAAKSKCAVNYFQGGVYESRNGVCIEIPQGGATLIHDVRCEKPTGTRYHAIAFGSENAFTDGSPRTDKNRTDASLCPWMWRQAITNPDVTIKMGRLTIRNLHLVVTRKARDGRQLGTAIWANPYIKADGNPVCRPQHEITGLTSEGGSVSLIGDWREL